MTILEENFKWHLEAFPSELFIYSEQQVVSIVNVLWCFITVNSHK